MSHSVDSSHTILWFDGVKLTQHRCNVLIRFRIGAKLHPITNNARQITCDMLIGRASVAHLKYCRRVGVVLVHSFGDAPHADRSQAQSKTVRTIRNFAGTFMEVV